MTEHTTPAGTTYTLRTPQEVPEGLRRPYVAKLYENIDALDLPQDGSDEERAEATASTVKRNLGAVLVQNDELDDLLAAALIVKWSLPLPVEAASMAQVSSGDYAHIRANIAPFAAALIPDFGPTPEDGTPFPSSEPSSPTSAAST